MDPLLVPLAHLHFRLRSAEDKLPEGISGAYEAAKKDKDHKTINMIVNSIVPRACTYAHQINITGDGTEEWSRNFTGWRSLKKKQRFTGLSFTQMAAECGSEERMQDGVKRGDITKEDGFYFWRQVEYEHEQGHREKTTLMARAALQPRDRQDILAVVGGYIQAETIDFALAPQAADNRKPSGAAALKDSSEAQANLEESLDAMKRCSNEVHALTTELSKGSNLTSTLRDLILRGAAKVKLVRSWCSKMEDMNLGAMDGDLDVAAAKKLVYDSIPDFVDCASLEQDCCVVRLRVHGQVDSMFGLMMGSARRLFVKKESVKQEKENVFKTLNPKP